MSDDKPTAYEHCLAQYLDSMKGHELRVLADVSITTVRPGWSGPPRRLQTRSIRLGKPDTRVWSTELTQTSEGLLICGDVPGGRPFWARGQSFDLLVRGDGSYLYEKFALKEEWDVETAESELRGQFDNGWDDDILGRLKGIADDMGYEDGVRGATAFADDLSDAGYDMSDGVPGYIYPPEATAMLDAIRLTYVRLSGGSV